MVEELFGQEKVFDYLRRRGVAVSARELRDKFGEGVHAPLRILVVKRKEVVKIEPPFVSCKKWYVVAELAEEFRDVWKEAFGNEDYAELMKGKVRGGVEDD